MRSVYLHKDKSIFKIDELPAERFAASLGLPGAPKIKFLSKEAAKKRKNASYVDKISQPKLAAASDDESEDSRSENEFSEGSSGEEASKLHTSDKNIAQAIKKVRGSNYHSLTRMFLKRSRKILARSTTGYLNGKTRASFQSTTPNLSIRAQTSVERTTGMTSLL